MSVQNPSVVTIRIHSREERNAVFRESSFKSRNSLISALNSLFIRASVAASVALRLVMEKGAAKAR